MNGRERYIAMIEGRPVDYIPRVPILMQFAAEYIGSSYGEFASDFRVLVKANIACARDFGMDQVSTISDPYRETQGFGGIVTYAHDSVPRCTHPLSAVRDLRKLTVPDVHDSERMLDRVNACRLYKEQLGGEFSILGWVEGAAAEAADLRDVGNFFMDIIDNETYCCELMDLCLDNAIRFAAAQVEAGADTIGIGDAIASQVSADTYERLILPREVLLVNAIKRMGAYVRLHICGNIKHILPGIGQLDIDIIDVDHMVDVKEVRDVLGDGVVIAGNIDPVTGIFRGTPAAIGRKVRETYAEAGNPFMVNAGCEIPSGTPVENLKSLCRPIPYNSGAEFKQEVLNEYDAKIVS